MKAIDLISSSARLAGILASGENLQGNEPNDGLLILQQMLDEWQADGLKIFQELISTFPLTLGQQTYTLGPGGNFNIPRPAKIQRAGMLLTGSNPIQPPEIPISVLDYEGWANIRVKNIQGNYPLNVYPDYAYPLMTLYFYQIPGLACSVVLYSWQPLVTWPDLDTTDVTFPPAYMKAIRYNLAVNLMPEFDMPVTSTSQLVVSQAENSLRMLKEINLPAPIMTCDSGLTGRQGYYDWYSDTYVDRR
jgi:hypothetical protein